jgi:hypothetical protein
MTIGANQSSDNPVKKGRGRPPKEKSSDELFKEPSSDIPDNNENELKRSRGRPKKDPADIKPQVVKVPGRGRGRPRKDGSLEKKLPKAPSNDRKELFPA